MSLKIISCNCQLLNANLETVSSLLNDCDVLLFQETLLTNDNSDTLGNINTNVNAIQVSSVRKSNLLYGRSSGRLEISMIKWFIELYESLLCSDLNYKDKSHVQKVSSVYCYILIDNDIELASSNLPKHNKRLNDVIIIGRNDRIESSHNAFEMHFKKMH